ncbi:Palmitoleoyl-protein carboxylesterase notum1a [Collichthys lucidus]|uniref:Palmitoleoyl-protein carboxylesterase notum1a n=1 Tax=Collichthys lucidus TaxID=240159 RepID=A0A4V6AMM2_COLLU|nr:Palmitoleoyl-protein carboxylesterase notum1a [Collichthys lucidus]
MDNFMVQIKNLAQSLYPCSAQKLDQDMKLQFLKNVSVTCNDGSPAGVHFTPEAGTGILSPQPEENPHWWNANMVFIPYCSSDGWSGATPKTDHSDYAFMGSLIIKEVVNELLTKGLDNAKVLLLAGSSAGGTGVLLNVDQVAEQLELQGHRGVQVRGLADSGWFLDNKQYKFSECLDTLSCAPTEAIKRGIRYWGSLVPESCRQAHVGEEWNCFFGYKLYPTLKSPVFVVQWLFDEAQLTADNIHLTGQPLLDGHSGERHFPAQSSPLLGPKPPGQQQQQEQQQQRPPKAQDPTHERLPSTFDRQLPVASLQPLMPDYSRSADRTGDERHPVPEACGL